jgi:GH25 family lysozyme M1 (1,4-beta-N-acetylmuramidase)
LDLPNDISRSQLREACSDAARPLLKSRDMRTLRITSPALLIPSLFLILSGCGASFSGTEPGSGSSAVTEKCGASATGPVQGVDVSDDQGDFDWAAAHVDFGFAQISDGLGSRDWSFDQNWARMKSAGVLRGAYQFFEPDEDEVAQANMVVSKIGRLGEGDLPAMIDVEVTRGVGAATIAAKVRTWLDVVEKGTGRKPIIYTGSFFWQDSVGAQLGDYPIWIAAYGPACPSIPPGWSDWTMWQYSDGDNKLDHDVFNGTLAQLKALSGGGLASPFGDARIGSRVVSNRDGRLEAFGRGVDEALWHAWQKTPGGAWSDWSTLGGKLSGDPQVVQDEDGRLEAFGVEADGSVEHIWQTTVGGSWSEWKSLGGSVASALAVAQNADGRVEVFGLDKDGAVTTVFQNAPNGSWSDWFDLGGTLVGNPSVGILQDGRLALFARTAGDAISTLTQTAPNGSFSAKWSNLGGAIASDVGVGINGDGRVEIFGLASDGAVKHLWQTTPNGAWSSLWGTLGGSLTTTPTVATNKDGRLEVFGLSSDKTVHHIWQTRAGGPDWASWSPLGTQLGASAPATSLNHDGRLELFVVGTDELLNHAWQKTAGGTWTGFSALGSAKLL